MTSRASGTRWQRRALRSTEATAPYRVSADEFERIAAAALDSIPASLRERLESDNLMITIQAQATPHDAANGIDGNVLGFFEGDSESVFDAYDYPKRIVLLQQHIEAVCRTRAELVAEVTETVLHEVAHYFGMDHQDMRGTRLTE